MKRFRKVIWIAAALLVAASAAILTWYYFIPNKKTAFPFKHAAGSDRAAFFVYAGEPDLEGAEPLITEGAGGTGPQVALPFDTVRRFIDPNIWYDAKNDVVTVTTANHTIRMQTDSLSAMINDKPVSLNMPVTAGGADSGGARYVPVSFLRDFYGININVAELGGTGVEVVIAGPASGTFTFARPLEADAEVRAGPSIREPVIARLGDSAGDGAVMTVYGEDKGRGISDGGWYRIRTADGAVGYIKKKSVTTETKTITGGAGTAAPAAPEAPWHAWKPATGRIAMTWELIYSDNPDTAGIGEMPGLDVIAPTWFELIDTAGEIKNRTDRAYVDWAHARGYRVWPTLTNNFRDPEATHAFLTDSAAKDNLMRKLLAFAALYGIDGVNLDFENINKADRDAYTQFVRELVPLLHEQGLTVSVDVNIPGGSDNWSLCYDHKRLAEAVDYEMLMAYDQHWATGTEAGSVAELAWVEKNIQAVLELVPADKLVLGIPFYTRLWKDIGDGKAKYMGVLTMANALQRVADRAITPAWDAEAGQYYCEYEKDGEKYMFWLEDARSVDLRTSLAQKYSLAGISAWQRTDGSDEVWPVIAKNIKGSAQ